MSRETAQWLNTMTLIGYTDQRDKAWHFRAEYQGDEPNHYPGAIPPEDVIRRLFAEPIKAVPLEYTIPGTITMDGVSADVHVVDDTRQVIFHPMTGAVLYVASDGYVVHQYDEWLIKNVQDILDRSFGGNGDTELGIASAGLLEKGGVAWVQVELPETVKGPGEFNFRPYLLAMTSANGTRATGYSRAATAVVCDNTLRLAEGEGGNFRVKHTANSLLRIGDAREALNLLVAEADETSAELERLLSVKVDDVQWQKFLDLAVPITDDMKGRGLTMAQNKLGELNRLYKHDIRVAPWKGTGLGVMQAMNTFDQHLATMRNLGDGNKAQARYGRTLTAVTDGSLAKATANYKEMLSSVTAAPALV